MFVNSLNQLDEVLLSIQNQASLLLKNGKKVMIDVKEHKHRRSTEQNNYYWLICGEIADFLNEAGLSYGEHQIPYRGELIHEINKTIFGIKTTTKLTISEFCQFMTKVIFFWQDKTNGEFAPSELPAHYLERKGYTAEYMRL